MTSSVRNFCLQFLLPSFASNAYGKHELFVTRDLAAKLEEGSNCLTIVF